MTYSSSLAAGRERYATRSQNAVSFRVSEHALGPISNTVILIVLSCLLGLVYLTQVTKTNSFGYKIDELQNRQNQLKTEHDQLEVAAARLQSLERVKNSEVTSKLVSAKTSETIRN